MIKKKNIQVIGTAGRTMLTDVFYESTAAPKPIIVYAHGFCGFKDWGNFDAIAEQFAVNGFVFVKFNFSHNGTTKDNPDNFIDLEAFAENNYTKELNDLQAIISWLETNNDVDRNEFDLSNLYLLGHSLGGGVGILVASEDHRVRKIATWSAVSDCKTPWAKWSDEQMKTWGKNGVEYYRNSRTNQIMPLNYQLYLDYEMNKLRLHIPNAISSLNIPILLCHGTLDVAVDIEQARYLKQCNPKAKLFEVESDHVFGRKHPAVNSVEFPEAIKLVIEKTISFFKTQ